jgi:plastocyanin
MESVDDACTAAANEADEDATYDTNVMKSRFARLLSPSVSIIMSVVILALMYGSCGLSGNMNRNKNTVRDTVNVPLTTTNDNGLVINVNNSISPGSFGISGSTGAPSLEAAVTITSAGFSPAVITVPVGSTVTWTNDDDAAHQPDADKESSRNGFSASVAIDHDECYRFTFSVAGTVTYHDDRNPDLKGTVIVE